MLLELLNKEPVVPLWGKKGETKKSMVELSSPKRVHSLYNC